MKYGTVEIITLRWTMSDETWSHWAQGRGKKTIFEVVQGQIEKINKDENIARKIRDRGVSLRCTDATNDQQELDAKPHYIEIQMNAADFGEACQRVGQFGDPMSPKHFLLAIVLESESWKQSGHEYAEFDSGWNGVALTSTSSSSSVLSYTRTIRLGNEERLIAWTIAVTTIIGVICSVLGLL